MRDSYTETGITLPFPKGSFKKAGTTFLRNKDSYRETGHPVTTPINPKTFNEGTADSKETLNASRELSFQNSCDLFNETAPSWNTPQIYIQDRNLKYIIPKIVGRKRSSKKTLFQVLWDA